MRKLLCAIAAVAGLLIAGPGPSLADPHKDESGHGRGEHKEEYRYGYRSGEEKYEWKSGNCKYERKRGGGSYKEEYKCAGYPRHAGGPPPWAPAHGYRRDEYRDYGLAAPPIDRSEEHTSELQSLMRISYAVFCLKKKNTNTKTQKNA